MQPEGPERISSFDTNIQPQAHSLMSKDGTQAELNRIRSFRGALR